MSMVPMAILTGHASFFRNVIMAAMNFESTEDEPQLPEGTTAAQMLEEYSEKALAEMAQAQGFTPAAFNRFLNVQARRERVAASVTQAKEILQQATPEMSERHESEVVAEKAVIRGMNEMVRRFGPENLTDEEIDALEREAYAALEEAGKISRGYAYQIKLEKIWHMFDRVVEARVQNEIAKCLEGGMSETAARREVAESLLEQKDRTNLNALKYALERASKKLTDGYKSWGGSERETRKMAEVQSIIDGYGNRALTPEESALLSAFVKEAKADYFGGKSHDTPKILKKYQRMLGPIFDAYRNYGPHKRTVANVSGPVETFTSYQSEREAGYRRVGKARPHRDPSGGNGESA